MRSVLFLFLLLAGFLAPSLVQAQKGLKLGFFALPQNTWMYNADDAAAAKDVYSHRITFGMAAGGSAGYNFTQHFGVRTNIIYSLQGQRWQSKNALRDIVTHNQRMHYLKVPIMIGFNTNTRLSKVIFSMYGGFQAGLLVKARYYNDDQTYVPDQELYSNILDWPSEYRQHRWYDYGPVGEIGVDVKLTYNIMANVRIRADYSLVDAENKNATYRELENGIPVIKKFYSDTRPATTNMNGGILFGLTWTITEQ
ncbi:MAG: PorT family protein [Bacteroidia bacterium]|nr:PorT family protein [Bacteroidia bacterium]